jgi:hypothetical protein
LAHIGGGQVVANGELTRIYREKVRRANMQSSRRVWPWYLLLLVPFVGTLWVPFFNSLEPSLGGVPYFYWYQFLWIVNGAALTAIVYFATRDRARRAERGRDVQE